MQMKKLIGTTAIIFFLVTGFCIGQTPQPPSDSKPASSNIRAGEYPRVTTDLKAIFRIKAPDAQKGRRDLHEFAPLLFRK